MVKKRRRLAVAVVAPLVGLLVAWTLTTPARAATAESSEGFGQVIGVSTVPSGLAWAVGNRGIKGFLVYWTGSEWKDSALVLPGRASELDAVDARTAQDIWAVGYYYPDGSSHQVTLIEHWDGSAWHRVPAPGPTRYLMSVSADSRTDAWAAGNGPRGAVLIHWDGQHWTSSRNKGCGICTIRGLRSVTAISPKDAWAVGYTGGGTSTFLTMHWDGVGWHRVPSALPGGREVEGELQSVSAASDTDVWAVGNFIDAQVNFHSFTEHWDGTRWTRVPSAIPGAPKEPILYGVAAVSAGDAWTAGYWLRPSRTLTYHWNGSRWTDVESPDPGLFLAVDASSSSNAWAVGSVGGRMLMEHWDGHTWSVT